MAVESGEFTELADEFAPVEQTAAEAGIAGGGLPRVRRAWVNVPAGGHVSAVLWGNGQPEVVFLHDIGESARAWDAVALAVGRPSVAIGLPGHGPSDWRRDGRYEPGKLASAVGEAIRSFAPRARLAVGCGLGGRVLDAVKEAAETLGIIQVINHGVPEQLITEFGQRIGRLLDLPRDRKAKLASPTGHPYRGWRQWPDDFGRLELERFNVGQFDSAEQARAAGLPEQYVGLHAHENVWPVDDEQSRELTFRYIAAGRSVAERVLSLYARAQGLPDSTFPVSQLPYLSFTVNNYPAWTYPDTGSDEDKLLLLGHADGSVVTILSQGGDYEGLQIQLPDGGWLPVPIVPGALQVFSGTLLTRWTNGLLRPARHRVVAGGTQKRRPVAIFCYPGLEQVLEPLAPFVEPGGETDYEPVTQWELVKDGVETYLKVFGRPAQVAAWREGKPYVAELAENSAGR